MLVVFATWGLGCSWTGEGGGPVAVAVTAAEPVSSTDPNPMCADPRIQHLAEGARSWASTTLTPEDFGTGTPLFDEEWLFGTWAMATVGLGQHARLCPSQAPSDLKGMKAAISHMLSEEGLSFDTRKYGTPLSTRLKDGEGSIAALGYGGLGLAMYRAVHPEDPLTAVERDWMSAIASRLGETLVETYPRERYPVDNAAAIAALALHDRVTGEDHRTVIVSAGKAVARAVDVETGLLHQAVSADSAPLAPPRGSGTFLSAWFLHRADPALGRSLYEHGLEVLGKDVFGIYAMREFVPGVDLPGDVDSGPLVMGFSVSATGFALGGSVAYGDDATRERLLNTVDVGTEMALGSIPGLQTKEGEGATGSALGDAILLAMLTSQGSP